MKKWRNLTPLRFEDYIEADGLMPRLQSGALGKFNFVLHLRACSSTTETDAGYLIRNNYEFTKDLAAWSLAKKVRFVYASAGVATDRIACQQTGRYSIKVKQSVRDRRDIP